MGLQRVFLTSLINMIFQAGESRERRIRFYLDEAATLGEIEALYSAVVYGRSFGLRLFFLFQSASQVELCFPKSKADDFRATVASLFCGTNDFRTAQEVSQWIGQTAAHTYSFQTSSNSGTSTNSGRETSHGTSQGYSTSETLNETARALVRPEEVLQLSTDEAIVLLPHLGVFKVLKMPYYAARRTLRPLVARVAEYAILATFFGVGLAALCTIYANDSRLSVPQPPATAVAPNADQPSPQWFSPPQANDAFGATPDDSH
jgi:type IV secretory pathway TraG/TraD family ATPase VirD4